MSFDSPFEKESEKDCINHKIQNFFEHKYNIDKMQMKFVDDLKLLSNMNYQIKLFENKAEILQEIINQKCQKCRMKLIEEMNSRSKTPTQTLHFHNQNHKQIQTNRSVTPTINSHNIRKKEKVKVASKPNQIKKKVYQPSSPDLSMKKNIKKQVNSKSPVPYNHMRLYTSVSKEKSNKIVKRNNNNKITPKKHITIDTSSPAITNTVKKTAMTHRALTPTMTLHKKKEKKKMNNEEKENKQKKETESLKESIQQLKESVKLVNDSVNKCEQKQKTPIKRTNITSKTKNAYIPLSSNKDKSPSLTHRTIQSNIVEVKEEKKIVKVHKTIQSSVNSNILTTNTINTLSSSSSSQSTIKKNEDLPLQMSSAKVKNQIQTTSKIVKKVNKQNIHTMPKQVNLIDNDDNSTIKEEIEETRLSSVKNNQNSIINKKNINKKEQCLLLLIKSGFLSINKKISLVSSIPMLYKEISLPSLLKEKISYIETVLHKITDFISKHDITQFNKLLIFSSTTQSSLNLIKKEDEYVLSHKIQPKEVLNLFTIIYIILDENYFKIPTQNLILNLVNVLLKKYNVDSISKQYYI